MSSHVIEGSDKAAKPKIVIVGAGLAGIAAASKLIETGFDDVIVLEAENRIGGRVHSIPFSNGFIDLGGQWCHGEKGNAIYELVHKHFEFGESRFMTSKWDYLISNGQPGDYEKCSQLFNLLSKIAEETVDKSGSLGSNVQAAYENELKNNTDFKNIDNELSNMMFAYKGKDMNSYYASETWFDVSTRCGEFVQESEGNVGLSWKTSGFKTVIDFITKKLPDSSKQLDVESKILLNKEVAIIKWNPSSQTEKATVTCADGSVYTADHVIVTASLGVLKDRHQTLFTPKLPDKKVKAIESISYGAIGKIFLEFDEAFWKLNNSDFGRFLLLWNSEDEEAIKGTDKEWLLSLLGFNAFDGFDNVLQAFIAGPSMKAFEALSDDKIIEDSMWLLEKFLGKTLPSPINMRRTSWLTNHNFLGAYTFFSMEIEKSKSTPKDLAEALVDDKNRPVVLFAGEATSPMHTGLTHGAMETGWRAAKEILAVYKADL